MNLSRHSQAHSVEISRFLDSHGPAQQVRKVHQHAAGMAGVTNEPIRAVRDHGLPAVPLDTHGGREEAVRHHGPAGKSATDENGARRTQLSVDR
jgi:hypothetical protein